MDETHPSWQKRPKIIEKMPATGRTACHFPENLQILPRKAKKIDVSPGSLQKSPKVTEKMLAIGRTACHFQENLQI